MQPFRSASPPLLLAVATLTLSALLLGACDTFTPADAPSSAEQQPQIEAARTWFDAQTATLGKSDGDAFRQFYPDWENGTLVTAGDGRHAVVTTVWRNYSVQYDSSFYFLRTLAVVLDGEGRVASGNLVEFASPQHIGPDEGPELVRQWLSGTLDDRAMWVIERSVTNEVQQVRGFVPGEASIAGRYEEKDCAVGLGKSMATVRCEVFDVPDFSICVGPFAEVGLKCGWGEMEICRDVDTPGGGGGGGSEGGGEGGGGSGGGSGDPGYSEPTPDVIDLVQELINALRNGDRFDDPALWRRLLGAYNPQAGQCVDAVLGVGGGDMNAQQFTAIINCAATYIAGFDGTNLLELLDAVPYGLEWAAHSAAGTDLYAALVQMARDSPEALRIIAERASNLQDLHALALLHDTSEGMTLNFEIYALTAAEALANLGSVFGDPPRTDWFGPDGQKYTAVSYMSSERSGHRPSIEISPCPAYVGVDCSTAKKYVIRFGHLD